MFLSKKFNGTSVLKKCKIENSVSDNHMKTLRMLLQKQRKIETRCYKLTDIW